MAQEAKTRCSLVIRSGDASVQNRLRTQVCELLEKADSVSDSIARTMIQAHCLDMLIELEEGSKEIRINT